MSMSARLKTASAASTEGRRGALYTAFLSMILMGAIVSMVGALLPAIVADLALSDSQAGMLVASPAIGYVVTAMLAGALGDALGFRRVWIVGVALGFVALLGVAYSPAFAWMLPAMVALGLVMGAFDGAINPLIAGLYGERSGGILNNVHLFFGMGATVTPFLVSLGLRYGLGWRAHFLLLSVYVLLVGLVILRTRFPAPPERSLEGEPLSLGQILRRRLVFLAVLVMFLYVGAESSVFAWSALFLQRMRGVPVSAASLSVSLFGGSIMVGRLICGQIAERVGYKRLIVAGSLAGALGIAILLWGPGTLSPWLGVGVTGLAYSGIFATIMAEVTARSPGYQGTVAGLLCTGSGLGQILFPWAVGMLSEASGLPAGMGLVLGISALMGLLYLLT
jgi:fucose permease